MTRNTIVAGLMSGTSLDGIDAVLVRIRRGRKGTLAVRLLAHLQLEFPRGLQALLLKNSTAASARVDEIARLNILLAGLYADAVGAVARAAGVSMRRIALIGSHGQTIHHLPKPVTFFGRTIRATLQIGDPATLAVLTGITTVGNFRLADMAAGGQGAPLVPYVDWLLFCSSTHPRALLNIGGIANITLLARKCRARDVVAFDTGPGNMVIDALMRRLYHRRYDAGGRAARRGMVVLDLLEWMQKHPYVRRRPPKSTGREEFGDEYLKALLERAHGHDRDDIIATATEFTAWSVFDAVRRHAPFRSYPVELLVSGGGARNAFMMERLGHYFEECAVRVVDDEGITAESKEAVSFAVLAFERMEERPANLPAVTGARRAVLLGTVSAGTGVRR